MRVKITAKTFCVEYEAFVDTNRKILSEDFRTWHKKELILVKPHYTSQTCSHCGMNTGKKPLHIRMFNCPHCHTVGIDRDINAAVNIRNKAFA